MPPPPPSFDEYFSTYLHPSPYQEKPVVPMLVGNTSFLELHFGELSENAEDARNYIMQNIT